MQSREELLEARDKIQSMTQRLAAAESAAEELSKLQKQLQGAESNHSAALLGAKSEAAELQSTLDVVSQERDELHQEGEKKTGCFCLSSLLLVLNVKTKKNWRKS